MRDAARDANHGILAIPDLEDLGARRGKLQVVGPLESGGQRFRLPRCAHHDAVSGDVDVKRLGIAVIRVHDDHGLFTRLVHNGNIVKCGSRASDAACPHIGHGSSVT